MTTTTSPSFDTLSVNRYEFANGRRPRGEGYWAFWFNDRNGQPWFVPGIHTFAAAKAEAKAEAKRRGAHTFGVCP